MTIAKRAILLSAALLAVPAAAQTPDQGFAEQAAGFIMEEAADASETDRAAMVDCVMTVFADLDDSEKSEVMAEADFEDSLDALVMLRPESEATLEDCLG